MVADLPVLERRPLAYRNRIEQEFDLDGALQRHPDLLLVDEYAHTNAPGSRHPKRLAGHPGALRRRQSRWWTTLNIQHLESLNDVIQKITRVRGCARRCRTPPSMRPTTWCWSTCRRTSS